VFSMIAVVAAAVEEEDEVSAVVTAVVSIEWRVCFFVDWAAATLESEAPESGIHGRPASHHSTRRRILDQFLSERGLQ